MSTNIVTVGEQVVRLAKADYIEILNEAKKLASQQDLSTRSTQLRVLVEARLHQELQAYKRACSLAGARPSKNLIEVGVLTLASIREQIRVASGK